MPYSAETLILRSPALRKLEAEYAQAEPSLMLRAGKAAAQWAIDILGHSPASVVVLAGPGNNGGDGFALARELLARKRPALVVCAARLEDMPRQAQQARQAWLDAGGQVAAEFVGTHCGLVVDALFGLGLQRPLSGIYAKWVEQINAFKGPVLSLDIPSGLNADTGTLSGPCVKATHTASFIALKPGLLTADGPDHCGLVRVFDLEISSSAPGARLLTPALFAEYLQPRLRNVHKGSFGAAGVIGGSTGMLGAAILTARAALMLGSGKVFLGALDANAPAIDLQHPEIMWRKPGDVSSLASVLGIGPGLGVAEAAMLQLRHALGFAGPLLLDADALNLLSENTDSQTALICRTAPSILTPHPAEAARLLHMSVAQIQADRIEQACELARRFRAVVLLKGCGSVIATPDGRWFINTSGHGGMASGGMGDALSGLILALLAQGWPPVEATLAGVHLHGVAAEFLAAHTVGPVGLTASETIAAARQIFNEWVLH